jgi:hypothetical protein
MVAPQIYFDHSFPFHLLIKYKLLSKDYNFWCYFKGVSMLHLPLFSYRLIHLNFVLKRKSDSKIINCYKEMHLCRNYYLLRRSHCQLVIIPFSWYLLNFQVVFSKLTTVVSYLSSASFMWCQKVIDICMQSPDLWNHLHNFFIPKMNP